MTQRNTKREGEEIDQKFSNLYIPLRAHLDQCDFNKTTGKIEIPEEVHETLNDFNNRWNYLATVINRKLKFAKAEFGAIKRKFFADVQEKELRMYFYAVSQEMAEWGLSAKDIEAEVIQRQKLLGLNPHMVCNLRILEIEPEKLSIFNFKHQHKWRVIDSPEGHVVICVDCFRRHKTFNSPEEAIRICNELPKTNLGLLFRFTK